MAQLTPSFLQEAPSPLEDVLPSDSDTPNYADAMRGSLFPNVSTSYSGRAAASFDIGRLADFASGTFMPAAIPVQGENFYDFGERAMLQGNGSAVKIAATPQLADARIKAEALIVFEDLSTANANSIGLSSRAYVQYEQLLVGLTETAFADPDCLISILDLAGPNARATILSPNGGGGQGRLSYFLYPSGSEKGPWIGNVSAEMPNPEIQFAAGQTPATTFSPYAHVPDLIMTWRYQVEDCGHLQFGSVFRDLALQNGDGSIDDSVFGWGLQGSGSFTLFAQPCVRQRDAIGYSVTIGEGIGHYINDLHVTATGQKTGGNDAVLNGTTLEVLPAQAYYLGYLHHWNDSLQSSLGYSRVHLDPVAGQIATAYRSGDYLVANCVFHQDIKPDDPKVSVKHFYAGFEYLFGKKEVLNGNTGEAHRFMFVVNFSK